MTGEAERYSAALQGTGRRETEGPNRADVVDDSPAGFRMTAGINMYGSDTALVRRAGHGGCDS